MSKRASRGEFPALDLEDIEDGPIARFCHACKREQIILVKTTRNCYHMTMRTQNKVGVCTNPDCYRYTNLSEVRTWVWEGSNLYKEIGMGHDPAFADVNVRGADTL